MPNHTVDQAAVTATLQALHLPAENILEVNSPATEAPLVVYHGVEDEEDARTRLSQGLGILAEHVVIETLP